MAVPSTMADLSIIESGNSPAGSDSIGVQLDNFIRAIQTIMKLNVSIGSEIASASTLTIPENGGYFFVTGTTTITGINNTWTGRITVLKFSGALTLTDSASFILFGSNITTAAGDVLTVVNDSSGVYRAISFSKATDDYVTLAGTETLTNKTIVAANNTITTAASGDLAATELDAALAELESEKATIASPTFTGTVTLPSGTVINIVNDATPQLGGDLEFNGKTANVSAVRQTTDSSPTTGTTATLNYAAYDMRQLTCPASGTLTIAFTGFPSGDVAGFILDLVNGGNCTVNWPGGMLFAGGESPALTTAGTDRLIIMSDKDGVLTLIESAMDIKT